MKYSATYKSVNNGTETDIYQLTSGTINAYVNIYNPDAVQNPIRIIAALMDKNTNKLYSLKMGEQKQLTPGNNSIPIQITVPSNIVLNNYQLYLYLLKDSNNIQPLFKKVIFPNLTIQAGTYAEGSTNLSVSNGVVGSTQNWNYVKYNNVILSTAFTKFYCNLQTPAVGTSIEVWRLPFQEVKTLLLFTHLVPSFR